MGSTETFPSEQKTSPAPSPSACRLSTTALDEPARRTRPRAAVTQGGMTSSPATLMYAAGVAPAVHPPDPAHGRRLTATGCALPEKSPVVSNQFVGTRPPLALMNWMVAQPRSLHGRAPRFQIASAMVKLPAAPPLRDCEKAIC